MFRNKKSDTSNTNIFVMKGDKKSDSKQKDVTIISEESFFKGNITISGDIHVLGHIKGNVTITEGMINIMQGGKIEGEIEAPDMIIDGLVDGACLGNNLDILGHGELRGISCVSHMSIKSGGIFIGQSKKIEHQSEKVLKLESLEEIPKSK
ncbi:MAG: bactofilin family protein [Candidatus Phlomobacter fragariae]